jgi:hypothetical protein
MEVSPQALEVLKRLKRINLCAKAHKLTPDIDRPFPIALFFKNSAIAEVLE